MESEYQKNWMPTKRAAFFEAVWNGVEPAELSRRAEAAEIDTTHADKLREEIERLKAAMPAAAEHPARQAAFARAQVAFRAQQAEMAARIAAFENQLEEAGLELNRLAVAFEEAEAAVGFLAMSDLIPRAIDLPAAVIEFRQRYADDMVHPPRPWQVRAKKTD